MHTTSRRFRRARPAERGMALVFVTFALAALLVAIAGALVTNAANTNASRNYRGAEQVHFVAESGLSDALQNINATGVINYQNDIVNAWSTRYGTGAKTFAPLAGYSYTVTTAVGANPVTTGRVISTATGPNGLQTTVVANLLRTNVLGNAPGAIYLTDNGNTNSDFQGNAFAVDGNDHNYTGGAGPGTAVPGISTRTAANTAEAIASLSSQELDNVQGYGYQNGPPPVPSISTSPWGPTTAEMNQFISDLQAEPGAQTCGCLQINNSCGCSFGSTASPQITTVGISGQTLQIKNNGNVNGAGVLIVNGNLDIQGSVNFKGLILVTGTLSVTGNATVYGSVWTQGVSLDVGGSAIVDYSTQALALANLTHPGGDMPTPMRVTSIADCSAVPSGTGGCP
jgi:hypothetical protein